MEVRDWQGRTGESWAAEWKRTDRSFGGLTERLLARTREFPLRDVVDIGCGAGELSVAVARGRPVAVAQHQELRRGAASTRALTLGQE